MISYSFGNFGFLQEETPFEQPLFLMDMGVERRFEEAYFFDNQTRPAYEGYLLQYTLKGCGVYQDSEGSFLLPEGYGFLTRMTQEGRYFLPNQNGAPLCPGAGIASGEWEYFYLHFTGAAAEPFQDAVQRLTGAVFSLPAISPPVSRFFRFFQKCSASRPLPYEGGEFLYGFLCSLLRALDAPADGSSPLVRQACGYFKEHFSSLSGIGEAADFCSVSQEHLTRLFKKETGQTPLQYLTRLRMENALFLLLNTSDSVASIARACGFENGNYFARVFRRYLNCSPEDYRKRLR